MDFDIIWPFQTYRESAILRQSLSRGDSARQGQLWETRRIDLGPYEERHINTYPCRRSKDASMTSASVRLMLRHYDRSFRSAMVCQVLQDVIGRIRRRQNIHGPSERLRRQELLQSWGVKDIGRLCHEHAVGSYSWQGLEAGPCPVYCG